jgi:hypothetical protein
LSPTRALSVIGLRQELGKVSLNADVDDPKAVAPRGDECCIADRLVHVTAAKASDRTDDTQGDVHGVASLERGSLRMR